MSEDYRELIERLRKVRFLFADDGIKVEHLCEEAATAIETLLAEREAAEWISVEDKLPENDPRVKKHIESTKFGFLTVLVYNGVVKQTNRFYCEEQSCGLPKTNGWEWASSGVTHWMPLPKPLTTEQPERGGTP